MTENTEEAVMWRTRGPKGGWMATEPPAPKLWRPVEPLFPLSSLQTRDARIAELEGERDAALRECADWARQAGFAIGKLETSELAGIVDDWKARALKAEAALEEAVEALDGLVGANGANGHRWSTLDGTSLVWSCREEGDAAIQHARATLTTIREKTDET